MEIIQYTPDMLPALTQFYNRLTSAVPHCYPVKEAELADAMCSVTGQSDNTDNGLEAETAFVAMQNGVVQAFIHVGHRWYGNNNEGHEGVVRFFGYERGARHAGQTVLEKAEEYLKTYNVTQITAFSSYKYHFYHLRCASLSIILDHVYALLGHNGYSPRYCQVFLDWKNYSVTPIPPRLPVTLSVEWKEGRGQRPNCTVPAYQESEKIGICVSVCGGEYSSHPDAQDWVYTEWLSVEEDFQGQGLGKYLLQYSLQEMHKVGYRHASLNTECYEYLPILFYSNCGYKVVDWTYDFVKKISEIQGTSNNP
ncbi:MAG: GNAT family N-acetyltransferase [Candidatus Poribacteria bacterium]|nr:GNAT family N-acetyltransferase [Candidatus Poribacteria bacterium]